MHCSGGWHSNRHDINFSGYLIIPYNCVWWMMVDIFYWCDINHLTLKINMQWICKLRFTWLWRKTWILSMKFCNSDTFITTISHYTISNECAIWRYKYLRMRWWLFPELFEIILNMVIITKKRVITQAAAPTIKWTRKWFAKQYFCKFRLWRSTYDYMSELPS